MRSTPGFLVTLILTVVWSLCDGTSYINPRFRAVLPSRDYLLELFPLLKLEFTAGLLKVLLSSSPPPIAWFRSLPSYCPLNVWSVYAIVLERHDGPDLLYIGSATASKAGARARFSEYRRLKHLPKGVRKAIADGYRIVHTANLAWCPIPTPSKRPIFRHIIVALEAALSCMFWAMASRSKHYGYHGQCPWSTLSFTYNGICSHNPLTEAVEGDLELTEEELEEIAAAVKEKNRKYQQAYGKALRAASRPAFKASQKARNAKHRPKLKVIRAKAVADKTYHCPPCDYSAPNSTELHYHLQRPSHKRKLEEAKGFPPNWCHVCKKGFKYPYRLEAHKKTQIHRDAEEIAA